MGISWGYFMGQNQPDDMGASAIYCKIHEGMMINGLGYLIFNPRKVVN